MVDPGQKIWIPDHDIQGIANIGDGLQLIYIGNIEPRIITGGKTLVLTYSIPQVTAKKQVLVGIGKGTVL